MPPSATDRDEDDYVDTDFVGYKIDNGTTKINVKPDLCDPLKYYFTNGSTPALSVTAWTVKDSSEVLLATQVGGDSFDYDFPSLGASYEVCLETSGGTACQTITPQPSQNTPKFRMDYDSCSEPFMAQFYNESTATTCSVVWDWDFGDGLHSNLESPDHIYAYAGDYWVTLKMTTLVGPSQSFQTPPQKITLQQWAPPESGYAVCTDGHIIYQTTVTDPSWTFPDGTPETSSEQSVRVCYEHKGPKGARVQRTQRHREKATRRQAAAAATDPYPHEGGQRGFYAYCAN